MVKEFEKSYAIPLDEIDEIIRLSEQVLGAEQGADGSLPSNQNFQSFLPSGNGLTAIMISRNLFEDGVDRLSAALVMTGEHESDTMVTTVYTLFLNDNRFLVHRDIQNWLYPMPNSGESIMKHTESGPIRPTDMDWQDFKKILQEGVSAQIQATEITRPLTPKAGRVSRILGWLRG